MLTNEEILTGNKLIGKFMGLYNGNSLYYNDTIPSIYHPEDSNILFVTEMEYHITWDWLMPVIEKIEETGYPVLIWNKRCKIECPQSIEVAGGSSKIHTVYTAVVEFIKWYNDQK